MGTVLNYKLSGRYPGVIIGVSLLVGPHQEEFNETSRKNQRVRLTSAKEDYGQGDDRDPQDRSHLLLFKASSSASLGWRP